MVTIVSEQISANFGEILPPVMSLEEKVKDKLPNKHRRQKYTSQDF